MPPRTLRVRSPAIPLVSGRPALEPVRLAGQEGINGLFDYELLLETTEAADLDLDAFIGRELHCEIALDDGQGGIREINALIAEAACLGESQRHARYRLVLRPWLHLATLRSDCRIFQDLDVVRILDLLLEPYGFPIEKRLSQRYPVRDYQTQFNESDFAFFSRLCQEWGINYHFAHERGAHRLVLCDHMGAHARFASPACAEVEYHAPGSKLDAEYLHSFVPEHRLTSGRYATRDHDYLRPHADLGAGQCDPRPTGQADGEVYQWHDARAGSHVAQPGVGAAPGNDPFDEGRLLARLRMQALRTHGARARASGNLRGMVPGCSVGLRKHPRAAANTEYLVLHTRFLLEDTGHESQRDAASAQRWRAEVELLAHPMSETLRPVPTQPKPRAGGPQVAVVVGPAGENLWTDALGRIKVQFPWDRLGTHDAHGSCWLRVCSPWAGNQLGAIHVPRIGQEVLVDFIGDDPDLPVCTGRVHNALNLPPWALPAQGALSGLRSRELAPRGGNAAAGRCNHLLMDDSEGEIQAQLRSDHGHSSLGLGFLTRVEDNAGRKEARGQGFELRTDAQGVLRAQDGLLLSTEARPDAAKHAKHMDETTRRLARAAGRVEALALAARHAGAQDGEDDQAIVAAALRQQNDALRGTRGDFPELDAPHLVLASPAGIALSADQGLHGHSGTHIQFSSGGHASIGTGRRLLASVAEGLRVFAKRHGIRAFASEGEVRFEAQSDAIETTASKDIEIVSTEDTVYIVAKKKVTLVGGASFSEWSEGGLRHGTPGSWIEHAALHATPGPDTRPTAEAASVCEACMARARAQRSGVVPRE